MSQPTQPPYGQQPPPVQPPPSPHPMAPPRKQKRFGFLALILTALISLGVGGAVGGSGDGATTAAPSPTVTETVTEPPVVERGGEPTKAPEPEPDPTTKAPAAWNPKPKDFKVGIKITDKQCFGSAGCNVSYKIALDYLGSQKLPAEGTTDITYEISGATDTIIGTITLNSDGKFDSSEGNTETSSSSKKLVAKVTVVDYNEFG